MSSSSAIVRESGSSGTGASSASEVGGGRLGQGVEEPRDPADRQGAELDERLAADPDGPGAGVEPAAAAVGAGQAPHVRLELGAGGPALGGLELGQQLGGDARPGLGVRPVLAPVLPAVDDHAVAGAVEPGVPPAGLEVAPGPLEHRPLGGAVGVGLEVGGHPLEQVPPPLADLLDRPERLDRPLPDRERRVGHEQVGVEVVADAQAVAGEAHPLRAVEAEELRARRVEAQPARRAGVVATTGAGRAAPRARR